MKTLEQTLNGGYKGLYGEVVTEDTYRLKQIKFVPDVVFDVGANVGIFSRYARTLFPKALIVALEPHPENLLHFRQFTNDPNLILVNKALGRGLIHRCLGAANGAGEAYLSAGLGYSSEGIGKDPSMKPTVIGPITLSTLVLSYWNPRMKAVLKVDCEGGENSIWTDEMSLRTLYQMDYIAMELHDYARTGAEREEVQFVTESAIKLLENSHTCERDGVNFWATKKL